MESSTKSVLIADDHAPTRAQLRAFLVSRNINVCGEAVDGDDTLKKVKELKPSIVLLDVYMPRLNGFVVAHEVRKIVPSAKIIFFTNHDTPRLAAVQSLGGDAFVSKAEGIRALVTALEQFLLPDKIV